MANLILDTHVLRWWSSEPHRLSPTAARAIDSADGLAVASVTWFELAWLAQHGRIEITMPIRSYLEELAIQVGTIGTTPGIGATAVALPDSFPGDPVDRIIFATAIETGWSLVTKDDRMHRHDSARQIAIW